MKEYCEICEEKHYHVNLCQKDGVIEPCPFCGSEASLAENEGGYMGWVSCDECEADGPMIRSRQKKEIIEAWNKRR